MRIPTRREVVLAILTAVAASFVYVLVVAGKPLSEIGFVFSGPRFPAAGLMIGYLFRRGWLLFASTSGCFTLDGLPWCAMGLAILASILVGVWRSGIGGTLLVVEGLAAFSMNALRPGTGGVDQLLLGWLLPLPVVLAGVLLLTKREEEAFESCRAGLAASCS